MKNYLIRQCTDETIVGVFIVSNLNDLWETVDEFCNPHEYEFAEFKTGGVLFLEDCDPEISGFIQEELDTVKWKTFVEIVGGEQAFQKFFAKHYTR